ncbi:MAG: hypothetical protein ACRELG_02560 [Gemmataceae bacterium]
MKTLLSGSAATTAALCMLALATSARADAASRCDRACLKGHVDQYLQALLAHDPSTLPLAANYKAIYNGKPTKVGQDASWKTLDQIAYHQYVMDPKTEEAAFFGVAVQHQKRGTLFLRLAVRNGKLTFIETIAGKRTLSGVPGLISPNPFFNYVLPPSQRHTRKQLIAIANSYFQGLQDHDGSKVPVSRDCRRFEDGVQTSLNPVFMPLACNDFRPFTYMDATADRIYPIVDVARGLVLGQMVIRVSKAAGPPSGPPPGSASGAKAGRRYFPSPASGMVMPPNPYFRKPHDTIIHELFKVVNGKITEIQTIRLDRPYGWGGGW